MSFGIVQPNKNSINSDIRFEIYGSLFWYINSKLNIITKLFNLLSCMTNNQIRKAIMVFVKVELV